MKLTSGILCVFIIALMLLETASSNLKNPSNRAHSLQKRSEKTEIASTHEDCEEFTDHHVPQKCETFDNSPCLCSLNPNCGYHAQLGKCLYETDCSIEDGNPGLCRKKHCIYDCKTHRCLRRKETTQQCEESIGICNQFCFDVCGCKANECQYLRSGHCRKNRNPECPAVMFPASQCGRFNAFYSFNGEICKNTKQRGNCDIQQTMLGANPYGAIKFTDARGIEWQDIRAYTPVQSSIFYESGNSVRVGNEDDAKLYTYLLRAYSHKRKSGLCASFYAPICENGLYELLIKTTVIVDVVGGEKVFNVKMNNVPIFLEVDLMNIAKERFVPIELIQNFRVWNHQILIDGLQPIQIKENNLTVSFCYSDCIFFEGNYEIAAVAVSKFSGPIQRLPTAQECFELRYMHYECEAAKCEYDSDTYICSVPPPASTKCVISPPPRPCLEVVFLLDSAFSSRYDVKSYETFTKLKEARLVDRIHLKYPCSKFGLAIINDFYYADDPPSIHFQEKQGCMLPRVRLTDNITDFHRRTDTSKFPTLRCASYEIPAFFSAMLAATSRSIGFTRGSHQVKKVFILIIHRDINCRPRLPPLPTHDALTDGTDDCTKTKMPPFEFFRTFFRAESIGFAVIRAIRFFDNNHKSWMETVLAVPNIVMDYQPGAIQTSYVDRIIDFIAKPFQWPTLTNLVKKTCPPD